LGKIELVVRREDITIIPIILRHIVAAMRWHNAPRFHLGQRCDQVVIAGVPVSGATIGGLQCGWCLFATAGFAPALLQVNWRNAERLLQLIDVTQLGGERLNDFL
jgi:hypothetical protein